MFVTSDLSKAIKHLMLYKHPKDTYELLTIISSNKIPSLCNVFKPEMITGHFYLTWILLAINLYVFYCNNQNPTIMQA